MCGTMMGQEAPKMPKHMVVAGQKGSSVQVYDCITKNIKSVPGYLRNIGIDNNGNVYILVSENKSGWGNYYVYKNYDTKNPYQSLVWNLYKFTSSGKRTFYSGHLGSVGLTWYGDSNSDKFDNSTYPGVVSEAGVYDTSRIYERQKWYTALH